MEQSIEILFAFIGGKKVKIQEFKQLIKADVSKNALYILSSNIITLPIGIVFIGLISRNLSVTEFGTLSIFITFFTIASAFAELGISSTMVRFSSYYRKNDERKMYEVFKIALQVKFLINLIILVIGISVSKYIALNLYHDPVLITPLKYAFFVGFLMNFKEYFNSVLRSLNKFKIISTGFVIQSLFQLCLVFLLIKYDSLTLFHAMLIYFLTPISFFLFSGYFIPWKRSLKSHTSKELLPKLFSFGKWMSFVYLLDTFAYHLDVIMLKYFVSSEQVGYYFAANKVMHLLWLASGAFSFVLLPKISEFAGENKNKFKELPFKIINHTAFIAIPMAFGMYALSDQIILIVFGSRYVPSIPVVNLLVLAGLSEFLMLGTGPILMNIGKVKSFFYGSLINVVMIVFLNFTLIPLYGIRGAAIGTSISFFVLLIMFWAFVVHAIKPKFDIVPTFKYIIASIVMMYIMTSIDFGLSGLLKFVVDIGIGGISYLVIVIILFNMKEIIKMVSNRE